MTSRVTRAMAVAVIHIAIVGSVAAKYQIDRVRYPRVWARAAPVDPNLPIRGRYVRVRLEVAAGPSVTFQAPFAPITAAGRTWTLPSPAVRATLSIRDGHLTAEASRNGDIRLRAIEQNGARVVVLDEPSAFFVPEHFPDPSVRQAGEELWVEVTLPPTGPPRPLRLGVKRDGVITPLDVR